MIRIGETEYIEYDKSIKVLEELVEEKDKEIERLNSIKNKIKEYCKLNKEFTPRLEDILEILKENK